MSAKFPRGGGAGPFLARSLRCLWEVFQAYSSLAIVFGGAESFGQFFKGHYDCMSILIKHNKD